MHLKRESDELEKILAKLESHCLNAKLIHEAEKAHLEELEAKRNAMPLCCKVPIAIVRKIDDATHRAKHSEYLWDKACEARNATRSLLLSGKVEL